VPVEDWGYPDFPQAMSEIWEHYINLANSRQSGMGMNPISYLEIQAYESLMQVKLSVFEVKAIKKLDLIALTETKE
jgi:hypothetical protein